MTHSYVFVRQDLSQSQRVVQSSHACIEAARQFLDKTDEHPHLVVISVPDLDQLMEIASYLDSKMVRFVAFFEPDISQYTSIATEPVRAESRKLFRKFKLLKE